MWQEERGFIWPTPLHEISYPIQDTSRQQPKIAILCEAYGEEFLLLTRMLAAINLTTDLIVKGINEAEGSQSIYLVFGPPPSGKKLGAFIEEGYRTTFYTYHPKTILQVPEVKPIAWSHLQTFTFKIENLDGSME